MQIPVSCCQLQCVSYSKNAPALLPHCTGVVKTRLKQKKNAARESLHWDVATKRVRLAEAGSSGSKDDILRTCERIYKAFLWRGGRIRARGWESRVDVCGGP